jgi:hypothetical protein
MEDNCNEAPGGVHEIDFQSIKQADVESSEMIMDVTCMHCGQSGSFRVPVEEIDW